MKRNLKIALICLFIISAINPVDAQIERYFRKSVSLFRMDIPDKMTEYQGRIVYNSLLDQLKSMGRFDYNPIPLRSGTSLERVFEIAKAYSEDQQLDRAAQQFELMDDHYKEERITGETLDKIIQGAYVIVPSVRNLSVSRDVKKITDKDGNTKWKAKVGVNYTLELEVWNAANIGSDEEPNWNPYVEDTISLSTSGSESETVSNKPKDDKLKRKLADEAVKNSLFLLNLQMGKALKKLDMFIIKASVTQSNLRKDLVKFDFGADVGLRIDDPFKVIFYEQNKAGKKKKVDVAYMKVREVAPRESRAQVLIVNNPYRVKESELINQGDQVLEHPKMGLNITCRMSYAPLVMQPRSEDYWMYYFDGVDHYEFQSDQGPIDGVTGLTFGAELDLAPFFGNSELYLFEDNTLLFSFPMMSGIAELGFRKKYYKRRLCGFWGASLGAFGMTGYIGEVPIGNNSNADYMLQRYNDHDSGHIPIGSNMLLTGWTMGLNLSGGINYLVTPELALNLDGGYRLYPHIAGGFWTIKAEDGGESWEMEIDEFTAEPPDAKISGLWYSVGFIFNL